MKKQTLVLFILFLIIGAQIPSPALAVEQKITPAMLEKQAAPPENGELKDEMMAKKVDYVLPYPGILADHPLYFLKKLRDQILEKLISDPTKKTEFYILQSDKQLNAGIFLAMKGKTQLAATQFSEEIRFMKLAVTQTAVFKGQGKSVPGYIVERLNTSMTKHIELLTDQAKNSDGSSKDQITGFVEAMSSLQKEVVVLQ
jgi:hypothetical protein